MATTWREVEVVIVRRSARPLLAVLAGISVLAVTGIGSAAARPAPGPPRPVTVAASLPSTAVFGAVPGASVAVRGTAVNGATFPVAGAAVAWEVSSGDGTWRAAGRTSTGADGVARGGLLASGGRWAVRARVEPTAATLPGASTAASLSVTPATVSLAISGATTVRSESATSLTYLLRSPTVTASQLVVVLIQLRAPGGAWLTAGAVGLPGNVARSLPTAPWRTTEYRLVAPASANTLGAVSNTWRITTTPYTRVIAPYPGRPEPSVSVAPQGRAVGAGANVTISAIPDSVWARMQGLSWQPGCPLGRSSLAYLRANYLGFDGYRHQGEMVTSLSNASRARAILTGLYNMGYPIRHMRLVDDFGRGPYRGANDYRSMAADNTSAFNCRYVVGKEAQGVMSPHAYGGAIDINTWENPYSARTGWFPNTAWIPRDTDHPAVHNGFDDPVVQLFAAYGYAWGGSYLDYHHFQR